MVIDCHDVAAQGRWWAEVLGWTPVYEAPGEFVIVPPHALTDSGRTPVLERGPGLVSSACPRARR